MSTSDEGDFLSDAEFSGGNGRITGSFADESGMNVALWIGNTAIGDNSDADTIAFCDETYEERHEYRRRIPLSDMSEKPSLCSTLTSTSDSSIIRTMRTTTVGTMIQDGRIFAPRRRRPAAWRYTSFCSDLKYYADKGVPTDKYYTYNKDTESISSCRTVRCRKSANCQRNTPQYSAGEPLHPCRSGSA